MKRFRVEFARSAQNDIYDAFEWGCREWGKEAAQRWARDVKKAVTDVLKIFPMSQPLAPESEHAPFEVRQIIIGRHRALFVVEEDLVLILHVRGPFVDQLDL
jgi:plasmid stabilization system protein ParE